MKKPFDDRVEVKNEISYMGKNEARKIIYSKNVVKNTVCDLYYDLIADLIAGGTDDSLTHGHCGTGTGQGPTDTDLATHCDEVRTAVDSCDQGADADSHKVVVVVTFPATVCTGALTECGLFSAENEETADMKLYDDSLDYNKPAGGSLEVTWTITHANS